MDEINIALNKFIQSVNNKSDINTTNNNLALLIAKMNIFYYKNNFFNNGESCKENNLNVTLIELEKIAEQIRNIYPKFMDLKKENFRNVYINKLNCNKTPGDLLKNIDKSNKIQSIITDLSDLLYFKTNDVPEMILSNDGVNVTSTSTSSLSSNKLLMYMLIAIGIVLFIILLIYLFKNKKTNNMTNQATQQMPIDMPNMVNMPEMPEMPNMPDMPNTNIKTMP